MLTCRVTSLELSALSIELISRLCGGIACLWLNSFGTGLLAVSIWESWSACGASFSFDQLSSAPWAAPSRGRSLLQRHLHVLWAVTLGLQLRRSRYSLASFLGKEVAPKATEVSCRKRRRRIHQRPPVRSTYNPVNERSDVHPQPLAPFIRSTARQPQPPSARQTEIFPPTALWQTIKKWWLKPPLSIELIYSLLPAGLQSFPAGPLPLASSAGCMPGSSWRILPSFSGSHR